MTPGITIISQHLRQYFTPKKPFIRRRTPTPPAAQALLADRLDQHSASPEPRVHSWLANTEDEQTLTVKSLEQAASTGKKRRAATPSSTKARKKLKGNDNVAYINFDDDAETDVDSDLEGSTLLPQTPAPRDRRSTFKSPAKHDADRKAMPPPPQLQDPNRNYTPDRSLVNKHLTGAIVDKDADLESELGELSLEFETKDLKIRQTERRQVTYNWDGRSAEARKLPADSGHWPQADKELFENLAMRGFRPLVPSNWTMDFDTLPLSLFHEEGKTQPPIVHCIDESQFRGKLIVLYSHPPSPNFEHIC